MSILEKIKNKFYSVVRTKVRVDRNLIYSIIFPQEIKNKKVKKFYINKLYRKIIDFDKFSSESLDIFFMEKRLTNLLNKFKEKKIKLKAIKNIRKEEEKELYLCYIDLKPKINKLIKESKYYEALVLLNNLNVPLNNILNNIFIENANFMDKGRYLNLLFLVRRLFENVIDFDINY